MNFDNLPEPLRPKKVEEPKIVSKVIGFGHRARSGKDTAVAAIVEEMRKRAAGYEDDTPVYDARPYSFARALKEEVTAAALSAGGMINLFKPDMYFLQENQNLIQLPEWVQFEADAPMDDPLCPLGKQRTLLQWWGTEFRRSVNDNYWINKMARILEKEKPQCALISDMRFPNEMAFVQKYGSAVRVDRAGLPPLRGMAGVHPSELALANTPDWEWDAIIKNDGTLEQFKEKVIQLFENL